MNHHVTRRDFLGASAAAGLGLMAAGRIQAAPFKTTLKKALIGSPTAEVLKPWKDAGFDGMETDNWNATPKAAAEGRKIAEKLGMRIHSVLRGWTNFNSEKTLADDLASVETSLRAAQAYGADAVLLVPCRIGGMAMPAPWEFQLEYDDKGHLSRVAAGDNSKYEAYIKAHNHATDTSVAAVKKLIPVAEKTGVVIALENVWNNLWVKPAFFKQFVASFQSPWIKAYFDIGNHVKYAPAEEWIRALGALTVKYHIKDFKLNPNGRDGRFVDIRDGSVNWPVVRQELDRIGYNGWLTIEGSEGLSLAERNRRLDLIVAGK
ncbi:MAG: sugar phosphate isomerase/epimerase family protein [Pirellulales bacterium]